MSDLDLIACANHLWQSTLFAFVAGVLTLTLRKHRAAIRYWLWLATSVKFLLPFSLLVGLGSHWEWKAAPAIVRPQVSAVIQEMGRPFFLASSIGHGASGAPGVSLLPKILAIIWLCGVLCGLLFWLRTLLQLSAIRRAAVSLELNLPIRAMSTSARLEPGVFGIFRPVLILPSGIAERLPPAQWHSVLAHELCHVRRRDNLTAAIHLVVETVFWFHPLVWWIRTRLVAEREQACDEAVLQAGSEPGVYAEGILNVCRLFLEAPPVCVSGISGADLKRRIENIVAHRSVRRLGAGRKLALSAAGIAAIVIPLLSGLVRPARSQAQAQAAPRVTFDVASVKPSSQAWMQIAPEHSGERIHWTTDLWYLVGYAYRLPGWRISGPIPGSDHLYAINATTSRSASDDQVRQMFQSLLADRFKMAAHTVSKEANGYALTVAKSGFKIPEAKANGETPPLPEWFRLENPAVLEGKVVATIPSPAVAAITSRRAPLSQFCAALERVLQSFVVDETGLPGNYYFALRFAREEHAADTGVPELAPALQSELGLKLEKRKGAIEMLVVDHIESTPTGN